MRFIDKKIQQRDICLKLSNIGYIITGIGLLLANLIKHNSSIPELVWYIMLCCLSFLLLLTVIFTIKFEKACEAIEGYNEALKAFNLKDSYEDSDFD